jgi:hypothetical protein
MPWLALLFVSAGIVVTIVRTVLSLRRVHALQTWARTHGWRFTPGPDPTVGRTYLELGLIGNGLVQATNLASGLWQGRQIHVFDLDRRRRPGSRDGVQGLFTCVAVKADMPLIPLRIRPEIAADRLASALGFNDIDFESAAFSAAFHVSSPDRKWAYDVLPPRQIEFLLRRPRWWLELGGWWCLVAVPGGLAAEKIPEAIATATGFLAGIPPHARRDVLGPEFAGQWRQR